MTARFAPPIFSTFNHQYSLCRLKYIALQLFYLYFCVVITLNDYSLSLNIPPTSVPLAIKKMNVSVSDDISGNHTSSLIQCTAGYNAQEIK
jgi:hypothetical protein